MTTLVSFFSASKVELDQLDPHACPSDAVPGPVWLTGLDFLATELTGRTLDELGDHEMIFPDVPAGWEGPWLVRVPPEVVTVLAEVSDDQLEALADRRGPGTTLRDLCQAAVTSGRQVYQWSDS